MSLINILFSLISSIYHKQRYFLQLSIKKKIAIHLSYRNVFNAPVRIEECKKWLGIHQNNLDEFRIAVEELKGENLISERNGFLCVKGNESSVDQQPEKDELTTSLLTKGKRRLLLLSKLPFIRYIGVSGSIAAKNPTLMYDKRGRGFVDLDLFVICSSNCLWILFLIERVLTNIKRLVNGHHFYCFNYVTDESFLEVYNKNFYTATEIVNLKTIYDDNIYSSFINKNSWHEEYYPSSSGNHNYSLQESSYSWTMVLAPLNFICFSIFCLGRAIKRREIAPLFEMFSGFNPVQKCNLKRISNPNGGYQEAIKKRFQEVYKNHFTHYYSDTIMEKLFPVSAAFKFVPEKNIHDKENADLFSKYTISTNAKNPI